MAKNAHNKPGFPDPPAPHTNPKSQIVWDQMLLPGYCVIKTLVV